MQVAAESGSLFPPHPLSSGCHDITQRIHHHTPPPTPPLWTGKVVLAPCQPPCRAFSQSPTPPIAALSQVLPAQCCLCCHDGIMNHHRQHRQNHHQPSAAMPSTGCLSITAVGATTPMRRAQTGKLLQVHPLACREMSGPRQTLSSLRPVVKCCPARQTGTYSSVMYSKYLLSV